jgi:hypothetical protein
LLLHSKAHHNGCSVKCCSADNMIVLWQ